MRSKFVLACVLASLVLGFGWQAAAVAGGNGHGNDNGNGHGKYGPHGPVITTSSSVVYAGSSLTVNCKNFASHESVFFKLYSDRVFLGQTRTNGNGSCSIYVTIPSNTKPGEHTIVATGSTGDSASTEITVLVKHHKDYGKRDYGKNGDYQPWINSFV
jgi:hypothetical protein